MIERLYSLRESVQATEKYGKWIYSHIVFQGSSILAIVILVVGIGLIFSETLQRKISAVFHTSPLEIIFDPSNPARRFWSVESAKNADGSLIANYWEHRVEIRNNGPRTLRNVGVTVERTGPMPEMPQDASFVRGKQNTRDLKPGCSDHIPVSRWPFIKIQAGMLAGDSAWGYGPIVITASADDISPSTKTFDFNYQEDQMLFEKRFIAREPDAAA